MDTALVLYGAGRSLPFYLSYFEKQQRVPVGLCDSDPAKYGQVYHGLTVMPLSECMQKWPDCQFFISVLNAEPRQGIRQTLEAAGVAPHRILTINENQRVEDGRTLCAAYHIEAMDDYFESAESDAALQPFWGEDTPFRRMFEQLDLTSVIELACGRGRHVPQYLSRTGSVILVDILEKNIDLCRQRFGDNPKLAYYQNSGTDLSALSDHSYTSLFTYDAMVHFESIDVYHYLQETARVLLPGGRALFHHSNNTHDYKQSFMNSVSGGRNYMSAQLFAHFAHRAGLTILEQQVIDWGYPDLDCLTLVARP